MDEMELAELQRAAFGPTLWHRKMLRHSALTGNGNVLPHVERTVRYDSNAVNELFSQVYLVPGGRYLISRTSRTIHLFDLDGPGRLSTRTSELIETITLERDARLFYCLSGPIRVSRCIRFSALIGASGSM